MKLVMKRVGLLYLSLIALMIGGSVSAFGQTYTVSGSGDQYGIVEPPGKPPKHQRVRISSGSTAIDCNDPTAGCWPGSANSPLKDFTRVKVKDSWTGTDHVVWVKTDLLGATNVKSQMTDNNACSCSATEITKTEEAASTMPKVASREGLYQAACPEEEETISTEHNVRVTMKMVPSNAGDTYFPIKGGSSATQSLTVVAGRPATKNKPMTKNFPLELCEVTLNDDACKDSHSFPPPHSPQQEITKNIKGVVKKLNDCRRFAVEDCKNKPKDWSEPGWLASGCKTKSPNDPVCKAKVNRCWRDTSKKEECGGLEGDVRRSTPMCQAATEQFYLGCDPWIGFTKAERQKLAFDKAKIAIDEYKKSGVGARKGSKLSLNLAECVMTKENLDYEPMRMNSTECKAGESTAVGLFQVVHKLMETLENDTERDTKDYCEQFPNLLGSSCTQNTEDGDFLHKEMSTDPDLQIVFGIKALDYKLRLTHDNLNCAMQAWYGAAGQEEFSCEINACNSCLSGLSRLFNNREACLAKVHQDYGCKPVKNDPCADYKPKKKTGKAK